MAFANHFTSALTKDLHSLPHWSLLTAPWGAGLISIPDFRVFFFTCLVLQNVSFCYYQRPWLWSAAWCLCLACAGVEQSWPRAWPQVKSSVSKKPGPCGPPGFPLAFQWRGHSWLRALLGSLPHADLVSEKQSRWRAQWDWLVSPRAPPGPSLVLYSLWRRHPSLGMYTLWGQGLRITHSWHQTVKTCPAHRRCSLNILGEWTLNMW